jgi:hypothetical protein
LFAHAYDRAVGFIAAREISTQVVQQGTPLFRNLAAAFFLDPDSFASPLPRWPDKSHCIYNMAALTLAQQLHLPSGALKEDSNET